MTIAIPKILHMIWIGPKDPPLRWMNSWPEKHPSWQYVLWDNARMNASKFYNQHLIDEYMRRGQYAGVSDLMRYEILHKFGGVIPEADSVCLHATDELFPKATAYTVYENEKVRPGFVSPIYACEPKNKFVGQIIHYLHQLEPSALHVPWISVGNKFLEQFIKEIKPEITIFPSYYFIPSHYTGETYTGEGKIYAKQMWGTTHNLYEMNGVKPQARRITSINSLMPKD